MKLAVIFGLALAGFAVAEEAPADNQAAGQILRGLDGAPWLGLSVGPLEDAVRAHVPNLPQGIGFVVTEVTAGSPAEKAGVKPYDIFWKLGDQWLANKAQLFTLLRLQTEGDEVKLGLYRSGEALSIPVMLGHQPGESLLGQAPIKPAAVQPDMPMKVLSPAERSAKIETPDGKAVLTLVNGRPEVKITSIQGSVVYEGPVKDFNGVSLVPEPWRARVGALERGLAHSMSGNRPPRLRVLPAAAEEK